MRRWYYGLVPLFALLLAARVVLLDGPAPPPPAAADHHTIGIHFSRFEPAHVTVRAGEAVLFELRNDDPIAHEWIVGDDLAHWAHRTGTEPYHDEIPTEVTVPAFETRFTRVTFDRPGEYAFICHLPGHEAYGMRGVVTVVE